MANLKRLPRELKHNSEIQIPDELHLELIELYGLDTVKSLNRRFFHPQDECLDCGVQYSGTSLPNFYFCPKFEKLVQLRLSGNGIYILRCTNCMNIANRRERREAEIAFQRRLKETFIQLEPHLELPKNNEFTSGQVLLNTPFLLSGIHVRTVLYEYFREISLLCKICKTQNYHLRSDRPVVDCKQDDRLVLNRGYYDTVIICSECTYSEAQKLDEEKRIEYYAQREEAVRIQQKRKRAVSAKFRKLLNIVEFTVPSTEKVENAH